MALRHVLAKLQAAGKYCPFGQAKIVDDDGDIICVVNVDIARRHRVPVAGMAFPARLSHKT
jgi:hypothetical protein